MRATLSIHEPHGVSRRDARLRGDESIGLELHHVHRCPGIAGGGEGGQREQQAEAEGNHVVKSMTIREDDGAADQDSRWKRRRQVDGPNDRRMITTPAIAMCQNARSRAPVAPAMTASAKYAYTTIAGRTPNTEARMYGRSGTFESPDAKFSALYGTTGFTRSRKIATKVPCPSSASSFSECRPSSCRMALPPSQRASA